MKGCVSVPKPQLFATEQYSLLTFSPEKPDKKFPLVVALHGTGQAHDQYLETWRVEAERRGVMVLVPRMQGMSLESFNQILMEVGRRYPVDRNRMILAGVSSGALVGEVILRERLGLWKGAVFIAAPDSKHWIQKAGVNVSRFPPILMIHGKKDDQFKWESIVQQVELLKQKKVDAEFYLDAEAGHTHKPEWNRKIFRWIARKISTP